MRKRPQKVQNSRLGTSLDAEAIDSVMFVCLASEWRDLPDIMTLATLPLKAFGRIGSIGLSDASHC
jgi:hypothetical protein